MLATPVGASADHYRGDDGNCNREGNCNDQRRCSGDDCTDNHRSFSPTFDKSPVDHSFNFSPTICVMPGSCTDKGGKDQPPPKGSQPTSGDDLRCKLLSLPWHCDPRPS